MIIEHLSVYKRIACPGFKRDWWGQRSASFNRTHHSSGLSLAA